MHKIVAASKLEEYLWEHLPPSICLFIWKTPTQSQLKNFVAKAHELDSFVFELQVAEDISEFAETDLSPFSPRKTFPLGEVYRKLIRSYEPKEIFENHLDATAITAGLYLWHDDLHTSHDYSQSVQGQGKNVAGDYWHGIMHRREPDYSNGKYWFRRVGDHPIFPSLLAKSREIVEQGSGRIPEELENLAAKPSWDPFGFSDICEALEREPDSPGGICARAIQQWEMLLLLEQTVADARS